MDITLLQEPFVIGLAIGLVLCLLVWVRGVFARHALGREIEELKSSLYTKLKIDAKAMAQQDTDLEELRRQNEALRITVATLQQKPGRAELRQLHVYDRALHLMLASAPGFAPAWEDVLKRAEQEVRDNEKGIGALFRRVFAPQLPPPTGTGDGDREASVADSEERSGA